jgi:hypothetical protein
VNREGHTIETYSVEGVKKYFVYLKNSFYCAHGSTIAEAIADAIWKDPAKRPNLETLKAEIREAGQKRKITINEFRVLTGACTEGCRVALERAKKEAPLTAKEIRDSVSLEWGNKLIEILEWDAMCLNLAVPSITT